VKLQEAEHLLDTYTLEEILNLNDLTEADALLYLINTEYISAPEITPLEFE
jgi:hypothetical protein